MPMPIANLEEYDKIIDVGWYIPDQAREEIRLDQCINLIHLVTLLIVDSFPCVLPFSQMYPMCCIDIRNFLSQVYTAPDDYVSHSSRIDETIRTVGRSIFSQLVALSLIQRNSHWTISCARIFANPFSIV